MSQKSADKKRKSKSAGKRAFGGAANKFHGKSKGHRHCTPLARYLRTGIKDHACTGS